jgi:hypothetical protein
MRKKLELLGIERAFVRSLGTEEEGKIRVNLPLDYSNRKLIRTAFLEAERRKAKALMGVRRRQFV